MKRAGTWGLSIVAAWMVVQSQPEARQLPPYGGAAEYRADLAGRRSRAAIALGPETVMIGWSAPARVFSTDVNYEYRQESNLLYLTGIDQEETILVMIPGARSKKEIIFSREADPRRELWNGHTLTPSEVTETSGITNVMPLAAFQPFMQALFSGTGYQQSAEEAAAEFGVFFDAQKNGKARLGILDRLPGAPTRAGGAGAGAAGGGGAAAAIGGGAPLPPAPGSAAAFALDAAARYPGLAPFSATSVVTTLRQIKTPYEQKLLRRSVEISAEAHIEGMKAARPNRWEYEVEAAIEYWYMKNGAMSWGYPSIVGSGPNATTLHYGRSTRQMRDGDLLLVDAAANYQGMTGDITRTYPINGKFTAAQRDIYLLVLEAQEAGIAAAKNGARTADIATACRAVFAKGLLALGLITATEGPAQAQQVSMWSAHGPTHGIGIDVHDPMPQTIVPGAAFVIEPGLYIRPDTLDNLPKTPENAALIEKVRPAMEKYKNIGVRIEDSFLMTEAGLEVLSAKVPKKIADIEKIVNK